MNNFLPFTSNDFLHLGKCYQGVFWFYYNFLSLLFFFACSQSIWLHWLLTRFRHVFISEQTEMGRSEGVFLKRLKGGPFNPRLAVQPGLQFSQLHNTSLLRPWLEQLDFIIFPSYCSSQYLLQPLVGQLIHHFLLSFSLSHTSELHRDNLGILIIRFESVCQSYMIYSLLACCIDIICFISNLVHMLPLAFPTFLIFFHHPLFPPLPACSRHGDVNLPPI